MIFSDGVNTMISNEISSNFVIGFHRILQHLKNNVKKGDLL